MTMQRPQLALVTGASSGIGLAFTERLARDGTDLVLVARREQRLLETASRLRAHHGVQIEVEPADLLDPAALRVVEERIEKEPRLDLLVNNAGFGTVGSFREIDADRLEREIRLNCVALTRLARAALPGFVERGRGAIVNVSSGAGFQPNPWFANYGATKAYVTSLSEALAGEVQGTGVRVQALCPGPVPTEFSEVSGGDEAKLPAFMLQSPEDVVTASLAALEHDDVVCVPSRVGRVLAATVDVMPRGVVRRLSRQLARRIFT